MSDTDPVFTLKDLQASIGRYAKLALATTEMLERVFGRDAVNAALAEPGYDGLVDMVNRIAPGPLDLDKARAAYLERVP